MLAALAVAGGAEAGALKCARPDEVTAIQAAAIQQELMVAALTCNDVSNFNSFQTSFNRELRTSDGKLLGMFHRLYGFRQGEVEYHAFKTRLANDSSMRSIHNNPDYCREAATVFATALMPEKPTLAQFVSGVQVSDASPVDSCEIRVATGLKGAGLPAIVPKPNPLRIAQTEPAPAEAPAPAPAPQAVQAPEPGVLPAETGHADAVAQSAPTDTAAAQPPAKKDSGWLSGLGNLF